MADPLNATTHLAAVLDNIEEELRAPGLPDDLVLGLHRARRIVAAQKAIAERNTLAEEADLKKRLDAMVGVLRLQEERIKALEDADDPGGVKQAMMEAFLEQRGRANRAGSHPDALVPEPDMLTARWMPVDGATYTTKDGVTLVSALIDLVYKTAFRRGFESGSDTGFAEGHAAARGAASSRRTSRATPARAATPSAAGTGAPAATTATTRASSRRRR